MIANKIRRIQRARKESERATESSRNASGKDGDYRSTQLSQSVSETKEAVDSTASTVEGED